MITWSEAERVLAEDGHLFSADGTDLGPVVRIYLDDYTQWPSFATITSTFTSASTDGHGTDQAIADSEVFVALHEGSLASGCHIQVPYDDDRINGSLHLAADTDPSIEEEDRLFDYYGVPIDGVEPAVTHLGSVMTSEETGTGVDVTPTQSDQI